MTEKEMRDLKVPFFDSLDKLIDFIKSLESEANDYGKAAYCASLAGTAAFNYICHREGLTGFQASCADLDIIRRTRHMEGPFLLIDYANYLYPQYNLPRKLDEFLSSDENRKWARIQAKKLLAESPNAHEDVLRHWRRLANE